MKQPIFDASKFERAEINFESKEVDLLDGTIVPIITMWTKKGLETDDPSEVLYIKAGAGDTWVNLRLLD